MFFFSLSIIFFILPVISFTSQYFPDREDDFFSLSVSGKDNLAENFFSNNNKTVHPGEDHPWNIHVINHMNGLEYVSIRVKLANSSNNSPDSTKCTPSDSPVIYEVRKILKDQEELNIPLTWAIKEIETQNSKIIINKVEVNSQIVQVDIPSHGETRYRIIVELWSYDTHLRDFIFGWQGDENIECAWTQVWFNPSIGVTKK
jgi:hypothetical protein